MNGSWNTHCLLFLVTNIVSGRTHRCFDRHVCISHGLNCSGNRAVEHYIAIVLVINPVHDPVHACTHLWILCKIRLSQIEGSSSGFVCLGGLIIVVSTVWWNGCMDQWTLQCFWKKKVMWIIMEECDLWQFGHWSYLKKILEGIKISSERPAWKTVHWFIAVLWLHKSASNLGFNSFDRFT